MKFAAIFLLFVMLVSEIFCARIPGTYDTVNSLRYGSHQIEQWKDNWIQSILKVNEAKRFTRQVRPDVLPENDQSNNQIDDESLQAAETQSFLPVLHYNHKKFPVLYLNQKHW